MAAYRFRFDSVLRSKKIIVDELSTKTARARRILAIEERKLEDLRLRESLCLQDLGDRQIGKVNAAQVNHCHRYLQLLGAAINEQNNRVGEIARRVDMLRGMLVEAEKEKKMFEKLEERDREKFFNDFSKKEQAQLDEIGVNRFVRRSAHTRDHSHRAS